MTEARGPTVHDLKCWPEHFAAVRDGFKPFEVRKNDRDFRVGDTLRLWEFDPKLSIHTGQYFHRRVNYALAGGQFGVEHGHVVLGLAAGDPVEEGALYDALIEIDRLPEQGGCGDGIDAVELWMLMRQKARAALDAYESAGIQKAEG